LQCECTARFHGDCVRVSGSQAPLPKHLEKCPKCVLRRHQRPVQLVPMEELQQKLNSSKKLIQSSKSKSQNDIPRKMKLESTKLKRKSSKETIKHGTTKKSMLTNEKLNGKWKPESRDQEFSAIDQAKCKASLAAINNKISAAHRNRTLKSNVTQTILAMSAAARSVMMSLKNTSNGVVINSGSNSALNQLKSPNIGSTIGSRQKRIRSVDKDENIDANGTNELTMLDCKKLCVENDDLKKNSNGRQNDNHSRSISRDTSFTNSEDDGFEINSSVDTSYGEKKTFFRYIKLYS